MTLQVLSILTIRRLKLYWYICWIDFSLSPQPWHYDGKTDAVKVVVQFVQVQLLDNLSLFRQPWQHDGKTDAVSVGVQDVK